MANQPRIKGGIAATGISSSAARQSTDLAIRSAISDPGRWRSAGKAMTRPVRKPPRYDCAFVTAASAAGSTNYQDRKSVV